MPNTTYLTIFNRTPYQCSVLVTDIKGSGWDEEHRPDRNFQKVSIEPQQYHEQRQDIGSFLFSAECTFTVVFSNGDEIVLTIDQKHAMKEHIKHYKKVTGKNADNYEVIQISGLLGTKYQNILSISPLLSPVNWMASLSDHKLISELTIPGTHQTLATKDGFSFGYAQCQNMGLKEQLTKGIRFLDVRCRTMKDRLDIYHETVYQGLGFGDVLDICRDFLKEQPTEFILMSVKEENTSSQDFLEFFCTDIAKSGEELWYQGTTVPTLEKARGKIVLLNRYQGQLQFGIDVSVWYYNTISMIKNKHGVDYHVQDICSFNTFSLERKFKEIMRHIDAAQKGDRKTLYLNFTSGFSTRLKPPRVFAWDINKRMCQALASIQNNKGIGIIALDFCGSFEGVLIRQLIYLNRFGSKMEW